MSDFIKNYGLLVFLLIAVVGIIVVLLHSKYKAQVKQCLLALVYEAEKKYGGKTGDIKFSDVAKSIWELLPSGAKLIISTKLIATLIDAAVEELKIYLENNPVAAASLTQPDIIQIPVTTEIQKVATPSYTVKVPNENK